MRAIWEGVGHVAGARVLRIGSSLAFHVLSARMLGPSGYGLLSHAVSGAAVVQQATDLGLGPAVGVSLAQAGKGPNGRSPWPVVRAGVATKGLLILLLVVLLLALPPSGISLFGEGMVAPGFLLGVLTGIAVLAEYTAIGTGAARLLPVGSLLVYALPVLLALSVVLAGGSAGRALSWWAAGMLAGVASFWLIVRRNVTGRLGAVSTGSSDARGLMTTAVYLGTVNLGAVLVNRAVVIALGAAGRPADAGILGAGIAIMERAALLGTAVGLSAGSTLAGWLGGGRAMAHALRAVRTGSEYTVWLAAGLVTSGPLALLLVFGADYAPLFELLPGLAPAVFLLSSLQMIGALLDFGGWVRQRALAALVGGGSVVVGLFAFGSALEPVTGISVVTGGLAVVLGTLAVSSRGRAGGHRVRGLLGIAALDLCRVLLVVTIVGVGRAVAPPMERWADAVIWTGMAAAVVVGTSWRRDWVAWPRRRTEPRARR